MYTCPEQKPSKHDLASMRSFIQEVLCFSWTAGVVLQAETLYYDLEAAPPPSGPNSLVCSHSLANHSNEWDTLVLET